MVKSRDLDKVNIYRRNNSWCVWLPSWMAPWEFAGPDQEGWGDFYFDTFEEVQHFCEVASVIYRGQALKLAQNFATAFGLGTLFDDD